MAWRSTRVLVGAAVAVAVLLILVDMRGSGATESLRGIAGAVAGPPERALAWMRTQVGERVGGSADERARIAVLERQLAQARAAAGAAAAGTLSEADTRALAAQAPSAGFTSVPGRVVSISATQDPTRSVAISAGSAAGVRAGLAVISAGGLAGLVDTTSPQVATVRLIIDPATQIAARVASSGEIGLFRGTGRAGRFELLDPLGRMAPGDLVVTLGTPGGELPADLPLGSIATVTGSSAALTRAAGITPAVDDSTLDRVAVLVPGAPAEGGS
jgi:rod shape-determining protein MreC